MYQGGTTFLPLRVNQAGVIPIIFAVSILLFPTQIAGYFTELATSQVVARHRQLRRQHLRPEQPVIYGGLYFLLTVGFTYFYTAFTFKPDETAEQLRKNGGFIPGIRPGRPTQDYLARVVNRITVAGRPLPRDHRGHAVRDLGLLARRSALSPRRHQPADRSSASWSRP